MKCEECQQELWKAGEIVPAGAYACVDDRSYSIIILEQAGPLQATFDASFQLLLKKCVTFRLAQHLLKWKSGH